jgi:deferrochelatase/peroxidase EfeB
MISAVRAGRARPLRLVVSAVAGTTSAAVALTRIDDPAQVRLAHATRPAERMLRRGFNHDDGPSADGTADMGLLYAEYQADADGRR